MALGFHWAGFRHVGLVEWEELACQTLRHNARRWQAAGRSHPPWTEERVVEADARDVLGSPWMEEWEGVDLVAGGPPCQPFSLGGLHAGVTDERNMFPVTLEFVRRLRPKIVVLENVPGLARSTFRPYLEYLEDQLRWPTCAPKQGDSWQQHASRLSQRKTGPLATRYRVTRQVINCADLGVPQARRRIFIMALRADLCDVPPAPVPLAHSKEALLYEQWVEPTYWEDHGLPQPPIPDDISADRLHRLKVNGPPEGRARWRTVRDMIRGLPEPVNGRPDPHVPNHVGIPGARSYPGHTGSHIDWPSKTIKAGVHGVCGGEAMIRFRDDSLRYLTVRESARAQSFPDDYEFCGARSNAMRHIGNAVAVKVTEAMGHHLRTVADL